MYGSDVYYWFTDLWYELTHLGTADVPMVLFKLVVLFVGFLIAKHILYVLYRVIYVETLSHVLNPIFRIVFFPFRLPWIVAGWLRRRAEEKQRRRDNALWEQRRAEQEQRDRDAAYAAEQRREQERVAEMARLDQEARIR